MKGDDCITGRTETWLLVPRRTLEGELRVKEEGPGRVPMAGKARGQKGLFGGTLTRASSILTAERTSPAPTSTH